MLKVIIAVAGLIVIRIVYLMVGLFLEICSKTGWAVLPKKISYLYNPSANGAYLLRLSKKVSFRSFLPDFYLHGIIKNRT